MIERTPERDAALAAMLPYVPFDGWSLAALRHGLADIGAEPLDAELLFPGGAVEMIEAFADKTDRDMEAAAGELDLASLRTGARVRALLALRLRLLAPHKEAVRRALSVLALPRLSALGRPPVAARCAARTAGAVWHAAGDTSADFNWYTKRALLAAVHSATLLFWVGRHDDDGSDEVGAATLAFLDRRLAGVAAFGKLRGRCEGVLARLRPGRMAA
jgi:ubiquinone biosynthesis protein COQ9